MDQNEVILSTF